MKKILLYTTKLFIVALALFAMLAPATALAQTGFEDDVDDESSVPIDNYIVIAFAGAILLGYSLVRKRENAA